MKQLHLMIFDLEISGNLWDINGEVRKSIFTGLKYRDMVWTVQQKLD